MVVDVYVGAPGEGKSYTMTAWAIDLLKKGKTVYSNYPIVTPDGKSTLKWKKELALENITNAYIFIDEAWKDYNSKDWKEINPQEHSFFAESRHNGVYVIIATQSEARIATLVKEIGEIVRVKKRLILYLWLIGFDKFYYESLDAYHSRYFAKGEKPWYRREFVWFKKYVAESYNSWQSDKVHQKSYQGEPWAHFEQKKVININRINNVIVSLKQFIVSKDTKLDRSIEWLLKETGKKYWILLKWLWLNLKPLRPVLNRIATMSLKILNHPLIQQLNAWMVS